MGLYRVVCKCAYFGTEKQSLSEWERHMESKVKNWKNERQSEGILTSTRRMGCTNLVVCKCGYCGTEKHALSELERHLGSKVKNLKTTVKMKGSLLPLEQWVFIYIGVVCKCGYCGT